MSLSKPTDFHPSSSSPSAPRHVSETAPVETADQLRIAIDSGRGGDKVDAVDPAASPLGTDDEAAGTPPTKEAVAIAARHEINARPSGPKQASGDRGAIWVMVGTCGLIGVGIAAIPFFLP